MGQAKPKWPVQLVDKDETHHLKFKGTENSKRLFLASLFLLNSRMLP